MPSGSSRGQGRPASSEVLSGAGGEEDKGMGVPGEHPALPWTPGLKFPSPALTVSESANSCRMDAPTGMGVKENEKLKSEIALCSGPGFAAPALALGILFSPRGVSRGTHVRQVTPVT